MAEKIAFSELNERSARELADESLLNEHRHVHGLAELGQVACRELRRVHRVLAAELLRRGMEHDSPLTCSEKAVEVERPHGFLVWKGKQTALACDKELPIGERLILVSDGEAFGELTLARPAAMTPSEFDRVEWNGRHLVRPEERRLWWPGAEMLYVHEFESWQPYREPQVVSLADSGVQFKDYQPPSEREAELVERSQRLPRQIVLVPRAVNLTGSLLYGQHEPRDTDVVIVGAEWRPDEDQFVVPLTPTFREKLMRVLRAVYESENHVQFIDEGAGATFDHLPLYDLALVRRPRLEVEHVSEGEPDFAALCYDKPELLKARHSRSQCMRCEKSPEIDVQWADGRGRTWFCLPCFKDWIKEEREVVRAFYIEDGEVPKKIGDNPSRNQLRTLGSDIGSAEIVRRVEKLKRERDEKTLSQSALNRKLRGASDKIKRQALETYEKDEVVPGRMVLSLKPLRTAPQGERQVVSHFYDYVRDNLEFPLYLSAKRDGATHYVHGDGQGKVWFFSDDGEDNTRRLPRLAEAFKKKYGDKSFVFGCEIEKWVSGEHYPREAAIGDVKKAADGDLVANVFRVVYWDGEDLHRRPFSEVWKIMQELPADTRSDGKLHPHQDGPINVVPHYKVDDMDELRQRLERVAYRPGVEGVVVKRADGGFPLDGEPGDPPTSVKWHKSVAGILKITGKTETKTKGIYVYDLAIRDLEIGKTFGTKQDISVSSAVEVEAEQVNLERDEGGQVARVSFWAPDLIGKSEKRPETLETIVERARKHGVLREKVIKPGGEIEYLPNEAGDPKTADKENSDALEESKQASFEPPKAVQEAAALGLELRRKFGRGGTQVGVARARDLSNGRMVSLETIQRMVSYFARHAVDAEAEGWEDRNEPSAGWVAWLLWGGDPGREWAERILNRAEKQQDILLRYPDESKKQRFVFQNHFRGRSVHGDFRAQHDDFLVGWTIAHQQPDEIKQPVETLAAARRAARESGNWKMDLQTGLIKPREIRGGTTRRGNLRAFPKGTEIPEAWLNVEGVTEEPDPGEAIPVGATAEFPGVFDIVQKGTVEYGAQKSDFHEYFIDGDRWGRQRWTFRLLERKSVGKEFKWYGYSEQNLASLFEELILLDDAFFLPDDSLPWVERAGEKQEVLPPGHEEEQPRTKVFWVLMQPVDQTPHVLSRRAVDEGWLPPKGVSALPGTVRDKIPKEMRYWETSGEKALERRRRIVQELDVRELVGPDLKQVGPWHDYVLLRRTWRGQTVIRFGPSTEVYDLWMKREGRPWHLVLQGDPRQGDPLVAYEDDETRPTFKDESGKNHDVFTVRGKVGIAPGESLNPTKDTPAFAEAMDRGQVRTLSEAPEFVKKEFKGSDLKGVYVFQREEVGGDLGEFRPGAGPETKESDMDTYICEVCQKSFESEEPPGEAALCETCQRVGATADEKAGRRLSGEKLSLLRELWDGFDNLMDRIKDLIQWAAYEDQEPFSLVDLFKSESGFAIKEVKGEDWFVTWSTNAFEDRQKEIFATEGLERFVAEAERKNYVGHHNYWHIPGTDFTDIKWRAVIGRFLVEAGPFLDDHAGKSARKFFEEYRDGHPDYAPEGWGCSPEYRYLPEERKTGVYQWLWIVRTSVLPKAAAANIWTGPEGVQIMTLEKDTEQYNSAVALFGKEWVDSLIEKGGEKTEELETAGVAHKNEEPAEDEKQLRKFTTALREIASMVDNEGIKKQLEGVVDGLTARNMKERANVVRLAAGRLEEGEAKTRLERIAAAMAEGGDYPEPYPYPTPARHEAEEGAGEDGKGEEDGEGTGDEEEALKRLTLEDIAGAVKQALEVDFSPLAEALLGQQETLKELTARMDRLEKQEARKKQTDLPRYVLSLQQRASQAEETVVDDEDDLKEKKPQETQAGDGSLASHYFPSRK